MHTILVDARWYGTSCDPRGFLLYSETMLLASNADGQVATTLGGGSTFEGVNMNWAAF